MNEQTSCVVYRSKKVFPKATNKVQGAQNVFRFNPSSVPYFKHTSAVIYKRITVIIIQSDFIPYKNNYMNSLFNHTYCTFITTPSTHCIQNFENSKDMTINILVLIE